MGGKLSSLADWVKGHALLKPESIFKNGWLFVTTFLVSGDELLILRIGLETNPSRLNDKIPCRCYITLGKGTAALAGVPVTFLEADCAVYLTILFQLNR